MFGFLKKKKELKLTQLVWKNETIKFKGILKTAEGKNNVCLLYYFNDTKTALQKAVETYQQGSNKHLSIRIESAQKLLSSFSDLSGTYLCFVEHHPSFAKENGIFSHLLETCNVTEVQVHVSFDEPLLKRFGSDNILRVIEKLGYSDDEPLQHDMILRAVINAQKRLDEQTGPSTMETSSAEEWFEMNLPKNQGI